MYEPEPKDLWNMPQEEFYALVDREAAAMALIKLFQAYDLARKYLPLPEFVTDFFEGKLNAYPNDVQKRAILLATPPVDRLTMQLATETRKNVPSKEKRRDLARRRLEAVTNIGLLERHTPHAVQYPGNKVRNLGEETQYDFMPQLYGIPTSDLDLLTHTAWENLKIPGGGGFDWWFQRHIYPNPPIDTTEARAIATNLAQNEKPYAPSAETLRRICFLGMDDEESFTTTTENSLLMKAQELGLNVERVLDAMTFSKISDEYRRKKELSEGKKDSALCGRRKTGEAYYCHPLGGAWIHLTSIESKIKSGLLTPEQATSDTVCFLLHDVLEDTPAEYNHDEQTLYLGPEKVTVQHDEFLILDSLTKKVDQPDWLRQITKQNPQLAEVSARLKLTDRLMNLLTMRNTGNYTDVLGKLFETVSVGGFIHEEATGFFHGGSFVEQMSKLTNAIQHNSLDYMLAALPAIAITEAQILEAEYGQRFYAEMQNLARRQPKSPIAKILDAYTSVTEYTAGQIIRNPYEQKRLQPLRQSVQREQANTNSATIPPWFTRTFYLQDFYKFTPAQQADIRSLSSIKAQSIEQHFAAKGVQRSPVTFEFLEEHIKKCIFFQLYYRTVNGMMLGNHDAFTIPAN
ncbi:MAG: hypothetical protein ACEQSA_00435 [Weeksellaceae bacterium]